MDLQQLYTILTAAKCAEDVFGPVSGTAEAMRESVKAGFRAMVQISHPDHCPSQQRLAEQAMRLLSAWRDEAEDKLRAGIYGRRMVPPSPVELKLRSGVYQVLELLGQTELYAHYRCSRRADAMDGLVLKLVRQPSDNDLVFQEAAALKRVQRLDPAGRRYFPALVEALVWSEGSTRRQGLILNQRPKTYSLEEIRLAYPDGIDMRDAAWIVNRLLESLWFVHRCGLVHGAVLPPHVRVSIDDHGLQLGEWAYSCDAGQVLRAMSGRYEGWYPPEVPARAAVSSATDIAMAVRCLVYLVGGDAQSGQLPAGFPPTLHRLVRASLLPSPARRTADAGQMREEFGEWLLSMYGKPTFRVFTMPA